MIVYPTKIQFLSFLFFVLAIMWQKNVVNFVVADSHKDICGYSPMTDITDHARVDLDLLSIKKRLEKGQLIRARNVYEKGGHSLNVAHLTFLNPPGTFRYPKGTKVYGIAKSNMKETGGYLQRPVEWLDGANNISVYVAYSIGEELNCSVGGLYTFGEATLDGCFNDGIQTVELVVPGDAGSGELFEYTYNIRRDNINLRTLQSFSLHASSRSKSCVNCTYYETFQKFVNYYGDRNYADKFIMAASFGNSTTYSNGMGDANFSGAVKLGRAEGFFAGITALNVFMQVMIELESSIEQCQKLCNHERLCDGDEHVRSLDKSVAYFCGSLTTATDGEEGMLLFALINERQRQFHPPEELERIGLATKIINHYREAQSALVSGDCELAKQYIGSIINLMKVPLVQSVIRYAYILSNQEYTNNLEKEKAMAFGATYTAALMPFLYDCNEQDGKDVYDNLRFGSSQPLLTKVISSLERQYQCLFISCEDVGELQVNTKLQHDAESSQNCSARLQTNINNNETDHHQQDKHRSGVVLFIICLILISFIGGLLFFLKHKRSKRHRFRSRSNIAWVSELS